MICKHNNIFLFATITVLTCLALLLLTPPTQAGNKDKTMSPPPIDAVLSEILEAIPSWEKEVIIITKSESELTEDVTQMLAQSLLNLGHAKDLAKSALGSLDPNIKNLRYTQTKFKITIARATLTRAASAALRHKVEESLIRAIIDLGQEIDTKIASMQSPGELS